MRLANSYLAVLIFSYYAVACSSMMSGQAKPFPIGDYAYTSYDKKGGKVAEGRLSITSVETRRIGADEVPQIKGNWELRKVGNQEKVGGQDGSGELLGSITKGEIYINLNPHVSDANLILRGTIDGKRLHGKWSAVGYAGPVNEGTFEAIRQ